MTGFQTEFRDNMARLMLRELEAMRREIEHYPDDDGPWKSVPGLTNTGGTLVLHVAGSVQHFIGAVLGDSGYVRQRDMEFLKRGASRSHLVQELQSTIAVVTSTMSMLDPSKLEELFPQDLAGVRVRTDMWLAHVATHLAYHLGQLDYHRRCVTGDTTTVGAMSIPALLIPFPPIPS